jgi:hypothetical protein
MFCFEAAIIEGTILQHTCPNAGFKTTKIK